MGSVATAERMAAVLHVLWEIISHASDINIRAFRASSPSQKALRQVYLQHCMGLKGYMFTALLSLDREVKSRPQQVVRHGLMRALEELFIGVLDTKPSTGASSAQLYPALERLSTAWLSLRPHDTSGNGWTRMKAASKTLTSAERSVRCRFEIVGAACVQKIELELQLQKYLRTLGPVANEQEYEPAVIDDIGSTKVLPGPYVNMHRTVDELRHAFSRDAVCDCGHSFQLRLSLSSHSPSSSSQSTVRLQLQMKDANQDLSAWRYAQITAIFGAECLGKDSSTDSENRSSHSRRESQVAKLCSQVNIAIIHDFYLHFVMDQGFLRRVDPLPFMKNESVQVISMKRLLQDAGRLGDLAKRTVALKLARAAMCLHGTGWLQRVWTTEDVVFIDRGLNRWSVTAQPYLRSEILIRDPENPREQRSHECNDSCYMCDERHPHLDLLGLGLMLMELYTGVSSEQFLEERQKSDRGIWSTAMKYHLEFARNDMTLRYNEVVKACLNKDSFEDALDEDGVRLWIFVNVVRPLEQELLSWLPTPDAVERHIQDEQFTLWSAQRTTVYHTARPAALNPAIQDTEAQCSAGASSLPQPRPIDNSEHSHSYSNLVASASSLQHYGALYGVQNNYYVSQQPTKTQQPDGT